MWNFAPQDVKTFRDGGRGNMATVGTDTSQGRFKLDDGEPFALVFVRVHFHGSATGSADLALVRERQSSEPWQNITLYTLKRRGIASAAGDADVFFRVPDDEVKCWQFEAGDQLLLTWTNPGTIPWAAEVGLLPL